MIQRLCDWLASTTLSMALQGAGWAIPLIQTIHIIAIAATISSMGMLGLRLLGVNRREQTIGQAGARLLPWMWRAVAVLAFTGALLITAEPARSLPNIMFQSKMLMLAIALGASLLIGRIGAVPAEEAAPETALARCLGLLILLLWVAIIFAGRWIAYV